MTDATTAWRAVFPDTALPPCETVTQRPWTVDAEATVALQLDIAEGYRVAATFTELAWVLEVDFDRLAFHAPRLVYSGSQVETRFPLGAITDGTLLVHVHPRPDQVAPSDQDLKAFESYQCLHPSIGFGVLSANAGRLYVMGPPTRPKPQPHPASVWTFRRWVLMYTKKRAGK